MYLYIFNDTFYSGADYLRIFVVYTRNIIWIPNGFNVLPCSPLIRSLRSANFIECKFINIKIFSSSVRFSFFWVFPFPDVRYYECWIRRKINTFSRLLASNTKIIGRDNKIRKAFNDWRRFIDRLTDLWLKIIHSNTLLFKNQTIPSQIDGFRSIEIVSGKFCFQNFLLFIRRICLSIFPRKKTSFYSDQQMDQQRQRDREKKNVKNHRKKKLNKRIMFFVGWNFIKWLVFVVYVIRLSTGTQNTNK